MLDGIQFVKTTIDQAVASGDLTIDGRREGVHRRSGTYPIWRSIFTP
ncbi:MAG: hypothetical protein U1E63_14660 [Burkholderiales bacterium]